MSLGRCKQCSGGGANIEGEGSQFRISSHTGTSFSCMYLPYSQYHHKPFCWSLSSPVDLKMQPEPSPVLSKLAQRQQQAQQSSLPQAEPLSLPPSVPTPPGHGHYEAGPPPPRDGTSPGVKLALDHQAPMAEPPQRQIKTQRRRVPPPSKVSKRVWK